MSVAFVFPGQGSQSVGMLSELAAHFPQVTDCFNEASDVLGYDLWQIITDGPAETLNQTDKTQPAMLAAGVAVWRCYKALSDITPAFLAGHSLGEYTALVVANVLSFSEAIKLVELRGQLMQAAVPAGQGAMAAILGLDDSQVIAICEKAAQGQIVEAVNFNSPGQVVIAGETDAIERAIALAKDEGAKRALQLPVSVPSHCQLMRSAADKLAERLENIDLSEPDIPVVHNVSVTTSRQPQAIKTLLAQQLYHPVRWVETVQWLRSQGVDTLIECGPGKVLTGLVKRIDKSCTAMAMYDPSSLEKVKQVLEEQV